MSASASSPASSPLPMGETRDPEGRVFTFYSYKGGTGRSMTLANVAWILASNGKRVLAIDWDLEAPGLHRYFSPFLLDPDLTATPGLMDLLVDFATDTVSGSDEEASPDWYQEHAGRILRYVVSLEWEFGGGGTLDLLPAGRQGAQYAALVNGFNWQAFYDRQGGGLFLEAVKERLRGLYDYVLVDSRTGVSDTAGICTVQLPDTLVACFTLNNQGIEGAAAVAASAFQQRRADGGLRVLPVPMRVENAENTKLQARWELAKRRLAPFPVLEGADRDQYWTDVAMVYKPFYAYEEVLATFGDRPTDPIPLLPAAERLASYLTGRVQRLVPPEETKRLEVLARYAGTAAAKQAAGGPAQEDAAAEAVFARLTPEQQEGARRLFTRLVEALPPDEGGGVRRVRLPLDSLDDPARGVAAALTDAGLLAAETDPAGRRVVQVAREEILTCWQRLGAWIKADLDFLVWRRRLSAATAEWDAAGRDDFLLLRGSQLVGAQEWARTRGAELTPAETAYVLASDTAANRARRRGLRNAMMLGVGMVIGMIALVLFLKGPQWNGPRSFGPPPEDSAAVSALVSDGGRLSDQGVYDGALVLLDSAARIDSTSAPVFVTRGNVNLRAGDARSAAADFTRAVELDPRSPAGYLGRAEVALAAGDSMGAITTLRTAYALVEAPSERGALAGRLQELGSRPVDRSVVVLGYSGSRSDSLWLRRIGAELDRVGYPLSRPWTLARNTMSQVRYFRDSRREVADSVAAVVQRSLDAQGIPVRVTVIQMDSLRYKAPPGSVTIWLPPMEPVRRRGSRVSATAPDSAYGEEARAP